MTQLAQQLGVSTTVAANGSESIYTDSGVTLFQDTPRTVSFTATPTLVDGANGGAVTVGGVPITGANSPMPIHSGALAGYAAIRDTLAPEYQAQLDQIAGGLINAFAESDQSATPTLPSLPGLFTTAGATSLPSMSATTGLAAAIEVNPNVDPSQGGNPNLLRDGGISDPGNPAYTYNTTGAASYTGRIQELVGEISATQSFDPSAGLDSSASLTDYANASVSWLQAAEPAGERRLLLSERGRNAGKLGVVERDRRQSGRRDDQHAEPRKLLRFDREAADDRQQHVHSPAAGGMTTVGANFVSTNYLANSLVGPVMQAQSQLTSAMTEELTGQYANLGLQLGDQSGYELSLKEQVGQLQTLTTGNSVVSTSLSTAQNALSAMQKSAQTTLNDLAAWTPVGDSGPSLQSMGQSALQALISGANTTSGDQYVFGGINSAVAPMADYYSTPTSAAKTAVDQAFQTTFGVLPTDPAAANISASDMQSFLSGPFAALFQGAAWSADWSSASSVKHERPDRARSDGHNLDQRQSAGLPTIVPGVRDAERIRRIRAQQRRPAGRGHGRLLARFARRQFDDQHSGRARLEPERRHQRQQFDELAAHDPARPAWQSRHRQSHDDGHPDQQPDQSDPDGLRAHGAPAAAQSGAIPARCLKARRTQCTNSLTTM